MTHRIEHVGIVVRDPLAMAAWYEELFGFKTLFKTENKETGSAAAFIEDAAGQSMLELIHNPGMEALADRVSHHIQLHIAITSDDIDADIARLEARGAKFIERSTLLRPGDALSVLYDPWGNCIQLVKRANPIGS